jgi:ferredoxin
MMFKSLRVRLAQGNQAIADVRTAKPLGFRGLPTIAAGACAAGCSACVEICPTAAIRTDPLSIDLGRCIFCNECVEVCPEAKLALTSEPRQMGATTREDLIVRAEQRTAIRANEGLAKLFKRSLKLRQVSAGGCNGCELELNATANVNFDVSSASASSGSPRRATRTPS